MITRIIKSATGAIIVGFMVFCTVLTVQSFIQYKTNNNTKIRHEASTLEKRVEVKENNYI